MGAYRTTPFDACHRRFAALAGLVCLVKTYRVVIDRNRKEFILSRKAKRIQLYFVAIAADMKCEIDRNRKCFNPCSNGLLNQKDGRIAATGNTL